MNADELRHELSAMAIGAAKTLQHTLAVVAVAAMAALVLLFGVVRLDQPATGAEVKVAGIVVDDGPESAANPASRLRNKEVLLDSTRQAARHGATLIVWNEAALFALPDEEQPLLTDIEQIARENHVAIVAAYAVVKKREPALYDNRYAWFAASGRVIAAYQKHHPVPGEPSLRGTEPLRFVPLQVGDAVFRAAGAICYDFDFSDITRNLGILGAEIVAVPSSDWRGIDSYHGLMARIGAISGGYAVLRPARAATSFAFDNLGRVRAAKRNDEVNDRVMMASLPVGHIATP